MGSPGSLRTLVDLQSSRQQAPATVSSDGAYDTLRSTRVGQLFTANWKTELLLSGYCYHMTIGTIAAGGEPTSIVGGGNGTTIDQDQPEWIVSVPSGYFLIPLKVDGALEIDADADGEIGELIHYLDLANAFGGTGTTTSETPTNMLDGGASAPGTFASAATADITDPTVSEILDFAHIQASASGTPATLLTVDGKYKWRAEDPPFLAKGPCAWYGNWGGTAAVSGIFSVEFAIVPISRFE